MWIVKIGGGDGINAEGIIRDLAGRKEPLILLHGANAARDRLASALGIEKETVTSVSGYSSVFSDERVIDLQMMAYAGLRNKRIVETAQRHGLNAVGLSGLDGRAVQGKRNAGIRVREGGKTLMRRDLSGKPQSVNEGLLRLLLDQGYTPVLCVPIADENGFAINSENDDILTVLAAAFRPERIFQFIEAPGFLEDKNNPASLVPVIAKAELAVREAQVEGRMKRKMLALRNLFDAGTAFVHIADGRAENPVSDALEGKGTLIR
ncbi:[LysW]-aminoadipate kinase [bacterium]|nr:[LysW]-aminoadipate kinase [bacterium]